MPTTNVDVTSIDSKERFLPIQPRTGLYPGKRLQPNVGGGASVDSFVTGVAIASDETWGQPSVITAWADVQGIASGENWSPDPGGLHPSDALFPSEGLFPHSGGISYVLIFDPDDFPEGEAWGDPDVTLFAPHVAEARAVVTFPTAVRIPVRIST